MISSAWDSSYVVDLSLGSTNNGAAIQIYKNNNSIAQTWKLLKVRNSRAEMDAMANQYRDVISDGTYYITSSKNTSYTLDVSGGINIMEQ